MPPGPHGGVADGIRTRDHRDHNPGLYQLSYRHRDTVRIPAVTGSDHERRAVAFAEPELVARIDAP